MNTIMYYIKGKPMATNYAGLQEEIKNGGEVDRIKTAKVLFYETHRRNNGYLESNAGKTMLKRIESSVENAKDFIYSM